jgi:HEAT repeat protein
MPYRGSRKRCQEPFAGNRPVGCFAQTVPDTFFSVLLVAGLSALLLNVSSIRAQTTGPASFAGKTAEQWTAVLVEHLDGESEEDKETCRQAAAALGMIGPAAESAVGSLSQALQSPSIEVRVFAVDALGRIGPGASAAIPAILAEMDLPPDHINYAPLAGFRRDAARSLGRMGPAAQAAVPALGRALKNEDPVYRVEAALALWRILARPQAIDFLAAMIDSTEPEGPYEAMMALGEIGPDAARVVDRVVAALDHPQSDVRRGAADVLVRWGPAVIEPVSRRIQPGTLRWPAPAAYVLGEVVGPLREAVFYREGIAQADFEAAAAPVLPLAAPALVLLMSHSRDEARQTAQQSLAQLGLLAVPFVLDLLKSDDAALRLAAAETLVRIESHLPPAGVTNEPLEALKDDLLNRLVQQMVHRDPQVRAAVFRAFASMSLADRGRSALPLLRRALKDENLAVRRYAAQAIRDAGGED